MSDVVRILLVGEDRASGVLDHVGRSATGLSGKLRSVGRSMTGFGRSMAMGLTLPIAAAAGESVKMAVGFNSTMTQIQTQAGASAADVRKLSADVMKLGMHSQQGPQALAGALYHLKSAGMGNAEAMRGLRQALHLANVGGASLEDTANALVGAWRSGIRGAKDFGHGAATLNAIIGAGNMHMSDLNGALGTGFAASARSFGLSLQDIGSALAVMTDEGTPANAAATRLRMTFSLLAAPSKEAEGYFEQIGLSGKKMANVMMGPQGLTGAIGLLKSHLAALPKAEQGIMLSRMFGGGRSSGAIRTLINNFDVLKLKEKQVSDGISKFGADVKKQAQTPAAKLATLKAHLEDVGIAIGTKLMPYVVKLAGKISKLVDWFAKLSPHAKKVIGVVAGLLAVMGPLLMTVGLLVTAIGALISPIGLVILAGVALGTAFVILWKKSALFREITAELGIVFLEVVKIYVDYSKIVIDIYLTMVGVIIGALAKAFGWIPKVGGALKTASAGFDSFKSKLMGGFDTATNGIGALQKKLHDLGSTHVHPKVTVEYNTTGYKAALARTNSVFGRLNRGGMALPTLTRERPAQAGPQININNLHMRDPQSTLRYLQRRARLGSGSGKVVYGL
ncbi:MAG TPA: phage tail tape measure protein [Nocardioides sp.]|nr:phage tail tape measure protein [Nocardioides sp.]